MRLNLTMKQNEETESNSKTQTESHKQSSETNSIGYVIGRINEVNQRRARLVLGWVIVCRWVNMTILVCSQPPRSTQPGHPSVGRCNEYQRKL